MKTYTFDQYLNIRSAISPMVSPDGRRVAFLSDITGNFQVWSIGLKQNPSEQWPRQLTFFTDKVWEIHGTKVTPHLIAVSDVGGNERQQLYLISNYGARDVDRADGNHAENALGLEGHDVRRLTSNDDAIHRFGAWSKDGSQIVYTSNERNNVDFDVYIMDVGSGESRLLQECSGNRAIGAWSPGGEQLILINAVASEQVELSLLDLVTGTEIAVTANLPHARYSAIKWIDQGVYCLTDRLDDCLALCQLDLKTGDVEPIVTATELLSHHHDTRGELNSLVISPDGKTAVVELNGDGFAHLYAVDLNSQAVVPIDGLDRGILSGLTFGAEHQLFGSFQSPNSNPDIWSVDLAHGTTNQITFSNYAGVEPSTFINPSLIQFESFDGLSIPAFFYEPKMPPPEGGYPCILYVHGGPASQQRPDFDVRFQFFLNHGYALLVTNVRGSSGYGRHYMMLDDLELRMESVVDLKHAVQWLHSQEQINSTRVAIYGRSYGGFMVLAALTEYPELFAAGIDVVGIGNWVSFMERTSPWRRPHREREYGSLEDHHELLERISPIHKAERIQMPLMVLAGDNDPRVPLFESEQIVEKVRNAGGTVEFVHYADEGHRFSKLTNRIDSFTKMAAFLERYL
ncbi:MAG: S9 family peptidase [Chloroflexota bacterium]